jgi:hypothetical protein
MAVGIQTHVLMPEIVDRLETINLRIDDPAFRTEIDRWAAATAAFDAQKPDLVLSVLAAETPDRG